MREQSAIPQKVPITERALIQRIQRKLRQQPNPEILRCARGERQREELGEYYTVEDGTYGEPQRAMSAGVCRVNVDLEKLGRELGVLEQWEVCVWKGEWKAEQTGDGSEKAAVNPQARSDRDASHRHRKSPRGGKSTKGGKKGGNLKGAGGQGHGGGGGG